MTRWTWEHNVLFKSVCYQSNNTLASLSHKATTFGETWKIIDLLVTFFQKVCTKLHYRNPIYVNELIEINVMFCLNTLFLWYPIRVTKYSHWHSELCIGICVSKHGTLSLLHTNTLNLVYRKISFLFYLYLHKVSIL